MASDCFQDGIGETRGPQVEKTAESAKRAVGAGAGGALGQRLERFDQGVSRVDIDAGILVGQAIPTGFGAFGAAACLRAGRFVGCYGSLPSLSL